MLTLQILQGPDRGKRFVLPNDEPQLIGRSSEALPISDRSVSRRHAELTPDDRHWVLRDLSSSNGTYVNGRRIDEAVILEPGDQIRCGSTLMLFGTAADEDGRPSPVAVLDPAAFDVTVERKVDANDDSMIHAEPDPLRAATRHLRVIYDLTALIAASIDRDELLDRIMDLIFTEFKPDRGFILLQTDPSAAPETAVARYRERPRTIEEGRIPVSRTIINHALSHHEGVLCTNAMSDKRFSSGDSVQAYGIRSAICVPIVAGERTFGIIHIDSSIANFTFVEAQLHLLRAIGQHTALALQIADLVQERMQNERLATAGETVASVSHSIKNILQGLRGGADVVELAMGKGDLDMARQAWPIVARNLDRIFSLTQNMLTYSKRREMEREMASLNDLVEEVAELMQPQADRKRAGLILDLSSDMPPLPIDVNAMHQVLTNLVMNAIEAVPSKTGVVTVRTRFDAEAAEGEIEVADNGAGIAPEHHERVFEAFASSKGQRGTGLGLAVSRTLVEEHGGRISLQSTSGEARVS